MQALTDPLSDAKTICHLCGKPHIHGPYDHERQLSINRWHRWERIKEGLCYLPVPVGFCILITLGALFGPKAIPSTPEEQREELRAKQRLEQIDNLMENLQAERDEIDPPQDEDRDPPSWL